MSQAASASDLVAKHCEACSAMTPPLSIEKVQSMLSGLPGWEMVNGEIAKTYRFGNYYQTIAFVNAIAWISHREDHHPDLEVSYNRCKVRYSTHAIKGISQNDLICAAKVEALISGGGSVAPGQSDPQSHFA